MGLEREAGFLVAEGGFILPFFGGVEDCFSDTLEDGFTDAFEAGFSALAYKGTQISIHEDRDNMVET